LTRHLAALAPGIEFAAVKRSIPEWSTADISYNQQLVWTCGERPEASDDSPEIAAAV
jgi:hypothetical protein